ncbi:MAG TPA: RcpC/CpaB family pilus assembly protein [Candidatus Dormibacteraeota bacterium]|nr:RcpC/CpaB family pilus assembly protein [Candidatus Dormibacteraeota bacterium]
MTTDLKGRVNQVWIAVGLICAIAAFGLAYYFTRASSTPPKPTVPANGELVVVARVAIPSGTLITPGMLEVTRIKGLLPTNAFTSCQVLVGEACATSAGVSSTTGTQPTTLSYYAVVPISANTVVTQNLVSPSKVAQTPSFGNLNLPPGDVAIAIPLTAQQAVAGYLQAGDRIDIIASTGGGNTQYSFEDIPVLGIGAPSTTASGAASSSSGGLVVLQTTRSQALGIEELEKTGAIYTIALRSATDYGHGYIPTTISPADNYTQACTVGTKVNPIIEEDLQQAQASVTAATKTYTLAQQQYNKDNSALQTLASNSPQQPVAKQLVLSDAATLAQDQFSLLEASNAVTSDQSVLYCGATAAQSQSNSSGYAAGNSSMMQNLFGFSIG